MPNIRAMIRNKRATVEGGPVIVCGNSDYTLTFTFDEEWNGLDAKTARFVYVKNGEPQHEDVLFIGDTVAVPVLSDVLFVKVGVFAGDISTTTPARILCDSSILCGAGVHSEPTPDVYNQIIAKLEELERLGQVLQIEENRQNIEHLYEVKAEQTDLETVEAIAKGKNRAKVFSTTAAMAEWLSDANNRDLASVGDNLYIEALEVPDYWVAEVLSEPDPATGYYYKVAQLETQKVYLEPLENEIARIDQEVDAVEQELSNVASNMISRGELSNYLPKTGGAVNGSLTANRFVTDKNSATGVDKTAFNLAQFVSNAATNTNDALRAGYGFHNTGVNGLLLYLDKDGRLRTINNMGAAETLAHTADIEAVKSAFVLSGDTLTINLDALSS